MPKFLIISVLLFLYANAIAKDIFYCTEDFVWGIGREGKFEKETVSDETFKLVFDYDSMLLYFDSLKNFDKNLEEKKLAPHKFYDDSLWFRSIPKDYSYRPDIYRFNKEYSTLVKETYVPTASLNIHLNCEKQNKD